jgi:predicted kinase
MLARRFALPLICKDSIKEPLFDVIGAADRAQSRRLSDASFAAMFVLARDCLRAGTDLILEGNFRPGEHEAAVIAALPAAAASTAERTTERTTPSDSTSRGTLIAQIVCTASEAVRIARLKSRATDLSRHAGHRDASFVQDSAPAPSEFLTLPGLRVVLDGDGLSPDDTHDPRVLRLLDALDQWRREA